MTTVTKRIRFHAAHLLAGYDGPCRNLHGHTYRVEVSIAGDDGDFVMDFHAIKSALEAKVLSKFDHSFMYCVDSPVEMAIAAVVESSGLKTTPLKFKTTVENLARDIYGELATDIPGLTSVKVWETPENSAEFQK